MSAMVVDDGGRVEGGRVEKLMMRRRGFRLDGFLDLRLPVLGLVPIFSLEQELARVEER